jgi:beta-phosphoglucomutase
MTVRAAIFDLDGTLIDTYDAHFAAWKAVCVPFGIDVTAERFTDCFGRTNPPIIRDLWAAHDLEPPTDDLIETVANEKEAIFRAELTQAFHPMEHATDLIASLTTAGWNVAIGTSAPQANLDQGIEGLRVGPFVTATTCGDEVTHGKPDPEVFLSCATKLNVLPKQCVVIEDAPAGIEAAQRGGMASVGLASKGRTRADLARADLVIDSLLELTPERLAALLQRDS